MSKEQALWQAVVDQALQDALQSDDDKSITQLQRDGARVWLSRGRQDFDDVCAMAGYDPEFIRDAYVNGRITPERWEQETRRASGKIRGSLGKMQVPA